MSKEHSREHWQIRRDREPETRQPRAKKDTKRWCLGVSGRHHEREIVLPEGDGPCRTYSWSDGWHCYHVVRCIKCSKILRRYDVTICPDVIPETRC